MKQPTTITAAEYRATIQNETGTRRGHASDRYNKASQGRRVDRGPITDGASFVEVELPIRIESALNLREGHWAKRHRRALAHDEAVTYSLMGSKGFRAMVNVGESFLVTICFRSARANRGETMKTIIVAGERLTAADQRTLAMAAKLEKDGHGIFPTRGHHAHFIRLCERNLLVYVDYGVVVTSESESYAPIYTLTRHGKSVAAAADEDRLTLQGQSAPTVRR